MRQQGAIVAAGQQLAGNAPHLTEPAVLDYHPAVSVHHQQPVGGGLHHAPKPNLVAPQFLLGPLALRDVANVALNDFAAVDLIDVADKLHVDGPAVAGFQRQVVVTDIGFTLQLPELRLGRFGVFERANLPEFVSQQLLASVAQHIRQERVDIINLPGVRIENQNPVLGGFKQPAVAHFGSLQRVIR